MDAAGNLSSTTTPSPVSGSAWGNLNFEAAPAALQPLARITLAQLDLGIHIAVYFYIFMAYSRHATPGYTRRFKKSSSIPLISHTAVSMLEIVRYHVKALDGPVNPDIYDFVMCMIQSYGTFKLSKDMMRGHPFLSRPIYQTGGVMMVILSVGAYALDSPFLHHAAVKSLDGFIFTRFMMALLRSFGLGFSAYFSAGVGAGALIAMSHTGIPGAPLIYVLISTLLVYVNRWTATRIIQRCELPTAVLTMPWPVANRCHSRAATRSNITETPSSTF